MPSRSEEHDRRAAFAQESAAQTAAVEAALRAAELNLEFTQVTSPINGRVRPGHRHAGQPRLERTGRSNAADHGGVARSGLRVLRRRRADLSEVHRWQRHRSAKLVGGSSELPDQDGAGERRRAFLVRADLDFLDNQLDGATGTIRGRGELRQHRWTADTWTLRPPASGRNGVVRTGC